jgi:amidase
MDELCYQPARVLAARLLRRELAATELLDAYLQRIDKHNPVLRAVVSADADRARSAAEAADRALDRGEPAGPLHGVPMTLKDGHDVAGLRTTIGTEAFDRIADQDGTVAARLRAAGAVIVGHSNVPPFLADYRTENPIFGRTSNPWDLGRTCGGSSGGAAAALAAGLTPVEVGSDLAGSLRLPAHFCGVYGLKATEHRVPTTGFFRPPPGVPRSVRVLTALGPMARDLADLELVLRVIAGPDGYDTEVPPVPLGAQERPGLPGLRLAVAPALPGTTVSTGLRAAVERVATLASDAGARVAEQLPNLAWGEQALFGELMAAVTGAFDPAAELAAEQRSLGWYLAALDRRDRFIGAWERFFEGHDALLLPSAATTAFSHETTGYADQGRLLVFANLAGLPALAVPAGLDEDGLPVGLQLVGPRWSEPRLLAIAGALEEAEILPGFTRPSGY